MPGASSSSGDSLIPYLDITKEEPVIYPVHHGLKSPPARISISWSRGSSLAVTYFSQVSEDTAASSDDEVGGKVIEVKLNAGDSMPEESQKRRIAYNSAPIFAMLQSKKNSFSALSKMSPGNTEWWRSVLEYSKNIGSLLKVSKIPSDSAIQDPKKVVKEVEESTCLKAAWDLMEIFFVDKESQTWLTESLADWLSDHDHLLSCGSDTAYSKLVSLQKKLLSLQFVEDAPEYWMGLSTALSVGWLDIAVKLLRLHGSYQPDQLGFRETENGLVEAVAVLVSTMPRLRPVLPDGKLGQCFASKSDFIKAWERWRAQLAKLEHSAFWVQCHHCQTSDGLHNLLQMMLGNLDCLAAATWHWMEFFVSQLLFVRPLTVSLDGMHGLASHCLQQKHCSDSDGLSVLLVGILSGSVEVVVAECREKFGPWMVVHAMELLTADHSDAKTLLCEECYHLGGISIEELYRLVYAETLSDHAQTWQIAPIYLSTCPNQGLGLLEGLLFRQPVHNNKILLKTLEICRLYELGHISSYIMQIAGISHWKHGRKGPAIYWLQQARDRFRLGKVVRQLFDCVTQPISSKGFEHWEEMIELLSSEIGPAGFDFLHKYKEFKKSLFLVDKCNTSAARQAAKFLVLLMESPSTPDSFLLSLLLDSVKLLNWPGETLLSASETNLILRKLQESYSRRLHPDLEEIGWPAMDLAAVRLALARNLSRSILES